MSMDALHGLALRAKSDAALTDSLRACKSPEEVIAVASKAGFAVSSADLSAAAEVAASQDLSDDQLDQVSGGFIETIAIAALVGIIAGAIVGGLGVLALKSGSSSGGGGGTSGDGSINAVPPP